MNESNTALADLHQVVSAKEYPLISHNQEQLFNQVTNVLQFFERRGYDYLNRLSDLHLLDSLFNTRPEKLIFTTNGVYRCFRGVTIAHLANNPDWNEIHVTYLDYLERTKAPEHQIHAYMLLIEFLNGFGLN